MIVTHNENSADRYTMTNSTGNQANNFQLTFQDIMDLSCEKIFLTMFLVSK